VSLLAPLGLLAGLLALPILALYFLRVRRQKVVVPSILLWQDLARSERLASPFDRFRSRLPLWLQLLLLALLALALARPSVQLGWGGGDAVVLIVDVSASMAATDGAPTRLAQAVQRAERTLGALPAGAESTLVVAGPRTEVLVPFTQEPGRVRAALRQLAPTEARGSLREGMQLGLALARSRPGVVVHVFSDGGGGSLADLPQGDTPVVYHRVGARSGNAGIVALDLRASPSSELQRQVFVTVQRFGPPVEGTVQVFLADQLVGLRSARLADAPVSLVFDLPAAASGLLRAELRADDDHLPTDDRAWAIVEPIRKRRVLAVGTDALTTRALAADPRVALVRRRAAELTESTLDAADAIFVAEPVSLDLQGRAVAWLGPRAGGPATLGAPAPRPSVLSWQRTHPILRLVALGTVQIQDLPAVVDPAGMAPLVTTTTGPLLLAGERSGARIAQLIVDPLRTDLPLRVAWPVLLLNTVGWLTEGRGGVDHGHVAQAGSPLIVRVGADPPAITVVGPDGSEPGHGVSEGLLRVRDTVRLGVYEIRVGPRRHRFAVNLQAPSESDLTPRDHLDLGEGADPQGVAQASVAGFEIWRWLAICALLVLVVEWVVWARRRAM